MPLSVLVATTFTPVSATFFITISPIVIGATALTLARIFIMVKIFSFGIGCSVFTGIIGYKPPAIFTVLVTTLLGAVISSAAYFFPRRHLLPVTTCPSSDLLIVKLQPKGQQIHIMFIEAVFFVWFINFYKT